ncbi:MAG: molybdopterin-synthase adenylyltransferase MoeB [Calditrichaceae bacterium]|nr:molybdopterin-synthase adenylyltransferase MoeB [Calditrichia bacterium]NUQ43882.1 molybdopterin-synthase adenylyltransferase MoeB [Calditrichaceae bacterium]
MPQDISPFSREEMLRYSRHFMLPEVGEEGQRMLKNASALVVGAGGLGSPAAMYLAAAGVGRLGLVDFDEVDLSNLQRQVLYSTADVGKSKLEMARERLRGINPEIEIEAYPTRLTSANALDILREYDVVVDGSDNFPTRYLVNDACALSGKPNVYGSIFRFEGQVSVFDAKRGPCYRCLYPEPPPPEAVPNCAEGGVLGVLSGIIGSLQTLEALKLILGKGDPLIGRLLLFEGLKFRFDEFKLAKNPACPLCGERPVIHELIDYEAFCGVAAPAAEAGDGSFDVTPEELKKRLDRGEEIFLLDVREPLEYRFCRLEGSCLVPLNDLPGRIEELDPSRETVVYCHHGIRSAWAVEFLRQAGFEKVKNLAGGIEAWAQQVDRDMPRY